jgi:hypothetical protein
MESRLGTVVVSMDSAPKPTTRDLCPWSGRFSASLMLSQDLRDWIGTDVFSSPVILRSRGESSREHGGVC